MPTVYVESDLFRPHEKTTGCDECGCVEKKGAGDALDLLKTAFDVVSVRAKQYNVADGSAERSMRQVVAAFNAATGATLTTRQGWLFMCCLKLVRAALPTPARDTFVDLAGYAALAGEERGNELEKP